MFDSYIFSDHVYFRYSCQNVNVAKRVVNCRFNLITLRISVTNCVLISPLNCYQRCMAAFITVNFRSTHAGWSCAYIFVNKSCKKTSIVFCFLFDEAERIRGTDITCSAKQLGWFSANQRWYTWGGNQRVETYCYRTSDCSLMIHGESDCRGVFNLNIFYFISNT